MKQAIIAYMDVGSAGSRYRLNRLIPAYVATVLIFRAFRAFRGQCVTSVSKQEAEALQIAGNELVKYVF
ncbi:MAG: hypothetical protein WAW41_17895 [Methylobacter sp.]